MTGDERALAMRARLPLPSTWRVAWCLPNTALGLAFSLLSRCWPSAARGILIATSDRGLARYFLARRGFYAITFGRVVITTGPLTEELLAHELEHVRQYERLGPLFIPLYLWEQARRGYRRNRFEQAAVAAAQRIADRLGNEAGDTVIVPTHGR